MEMLTEQFKSFVNIEQEEFVPILETMFHQRKKDGRRFLCLMNNLLNYHLSQQNVDNEINYHIIHIPACESWARELLIRFVIHKMALCLNKTSIDRLVSTIKRSYTIKEGKAGSKEAQQINARNKYLRQTGNTFKKLNIPQDDRKSLILTKEQDFISKKSDKNPWINEYFSDNIFDKNHNLIQSTTTTAYDLEKLIRGNEKYNMPTIESIFIFHSPNKSKLTNSYSKNQLERLNKYGLGIKTCFIISFSEKPFRLYHAIDDVKYRLSSAILQKSISKFDDFNGFVTFTQSEANYIFNRTPNQNIVLIDCTESNFFTQEIDQFIDSIPNNLKHKNNLALSFSDNLQNIYSQTIAHEIKGFSKEICGGFFSLLQNIWNVDIKNQTEHFLNDASSVGLILQKGTPKPIKSSLIHLFQKNNRKIKEYSLDELKEGINVEKIIVLQYRSANGYYKPYPNSFDQLPLKKSQSALIIINKLTHNNYYEWDNYWYSLSYNGLLFSKFRNDVLGWKMQKYQRPTSPNVKDFIDEAESDTRAYQTEKCKIYYKDGRKPREWLACERVIYEKNNLRCIAELKNISELENISIQMMSELVEQVKYFISEKSKDNSNAEQIIRRDSRYGLSDPEINSATELWKFLLKRRVLSVGEQEAYDELFSQIPENERISLSTFNQWHNFDNAIILPRSRKHQKALLVYLGFEIGSAYHRIVLSKKMSNINGSRLLNSQIDTFLQKFLINDIKESDFNLLAESHSDIITLLDIRNIGDINALISLLEISLTPIERIEYDQD